VIPVLHNLIILSRNADEYCNLIEAAALPDLRIIVAATHPSQVDPTNRDCNILFGDPSMISEVLDKLPGLRWVQATWAGVEPLLKPGLRRDYLLTNARVVFGPLMSEYVFAYLLLHERRVLERCQAQQKQTWDGSITGTLRGKTIGLLGVGSIGAHLASTAKHFGMKVRGYTRTSQACVDVDTYYHGADLQIFTSGLDYLVNSLPNTAETRHLVDSSMLGWLPRYAILINVGRGSTLDDAALVAALSTGQIAGAVLDVFEQEPLPPGHMFWNTPNLYMTFHTAAPSIPSDLAGLFIENYQSYRQNLPLQHLVDFERGY
jgi:phosphoglycerate dehydrogenase-like enzyme